MRVFTVFIQILVMSNLMSQQAVKSIDLSTYNWRSIGPAFMSGRVIDIAVDPTDPNTYYIGVASGGVFKTANNGVTFDPIFENYSSYSIGSITIDPNNHNVIWVGTGEANNQRSVGYGDGVYKSEDGGKSFINMGLKNSNHVGEIIINPSNSNIVYVAAYGPLWSSGGERGVYKSEDGGKNWTQILKVSEHTGIADIVMDPKNPEIIYASAHQRQRKGYGYVSGGPESGLYKSVDSGKNWTKINSGLPTVDRGRIAIAVSPINTDVLYCHLEAAEDKGGSYLSTDRGASWQRQSDYASSGLYYGKIFPDPIQLHKIYTGDVYPKVSTDGGKNFSNLPIANVHVDNHTFWIDPKNNQHLMLGGDGGLYETWNQGQKWHFKSNLSITQFYRVSTDNSTPFYNVFGGTQDNSSMGGPSRTINSAGIPNSDWYLTQGGDGFETQVDWTDPNIIYAQAQHGWVSRFDKKSGESVPVKPIELDGEPALRWNWDSPLVLSKYNSNRLYFGANKIYRSDDRGDNWELISPDLSRQLDRNTLPYMDKIWSVDAVKKNTSTSIWGSVTSISESPIDPNTIYAGTDDGLIQITTDGGNNWKKVDNIKGVPSMSYIPQIICSAHDKNAAFVVFNHHRYGDFKPYIFKTTDGGNTWKTIQSNLPERGSLYTLAEDHNDANLLFVGSDFGAFVSVDGGGQWNALKSGLPTIPVKDIEIQKRENDVVIATFGRGFYVLDNYSNIRDLAKLQSDKNAIFQTKDPWMYYENSPLGGGWGSPFGTQGDSYYAGENPEYGAVVRFYVNEVPSTIKERRKKNEKELIDKNTLKGYPSKDSLIAEDTEIEGYHIMSIIDKDGKIVFKEKVSPKKGINKWIWDLTSVNGYSLNLSNKSGANSGLPVLPGSYKARLSYFDGNAIKVLSEGPSFNVKSLGWTCIPASNINDVKAYAKDVTAMAKVVYGTADHVTWLEGKLKTLQAAFLALPDANPQWASEMHAMQKQISTIKLKLFGNSAIENRQFEVLPGIRDRVSTAVWAAYGHNSNIPSTQKKSLQLAEREFKPVYAEVQEIHEKIAKLQEEILKAGAPYIEGSFPIWEK